MLKRRKALFKQQAHAEKEELIYAAGYQFEPDLADAIERLRRVNCMVVEFKERLGVVRDYVSVEVKDYQANKEMIYMVNWEIAQAVIQWKHRLQAEGKLQAVAVQPQMPIKDPTTPVQEDEYENLEPYSERKPLLPPDPLKVDSYAVSLTAK